MIMNESVKKTYLDFVLDEFNPEGIIIFNVPRNRVNINFEDLPSKLDVTYSFNFGTFSFNCVLGIFIEMMLDGLIPLEFVMTSIDCAFFNDVSSKINSKLEMYYEDMTMEDILMIKMSI